MNNRKNTTLSIIVPIYNVEKYLDKCIESLINQTHDDYEIILVNDGSIDTSLEICNRYSFNNRIKIVSKENGGLVSARKYGLKFAKGKYIACVDGDDWVSNEFVKKIYDEIIKCKPDVICFNYYKVINEKELKINNFSNERLDRKHIKKRIFNKLIQDIDATYFIPNLWGKAYKTELYREIQNKIDDSIKIGEDGACTIPIIYKSNSISFLNDSLYYYRVNNSSMTRNMSVFDKYGPMKVAESIAANIDIRKYNFEQQLYRKIVHDLFSTIITQFNRKTNYSETKKEIKDILNYEYYKNAMERCEYRNSIAAIFMHFSLKHKLIDIIYLWYLFNYKY